MPTVQRGRKLAPERKQILDRCVEDGWPIRQIQETHGFNFQTVKKHHPDYKGMPQRESVQLAVMLRRVNRVLETT